MSDHSTLEKLTAENARLRSRVEEMEQLITDLEISLETAVEHGDLIEDQLGAANTQLQEQISERKIAERRLQKLTDALKQQKDDLEIVVGTLIDHGDSMDTQWVEALTESEQRGATDHLTGLANRRQFDEHLDKQFKSCARNKRPLSLLMCDVDHFKIFNDTYGHLEGDSCLKNLAGIIAQASHRSSDLAARYGGEEFSVILPETDREGAIAIAEKLVENVWALKIPNKGSSVGDYVTVSIGLKTIVPEPSGSPTALVAAADHVLYVAKQKGRNQVCADEEETFEGDVKLTETIKIYGTFVDNPENAEEYLILAFSPSSRPLKDRWRNNGLSADFLADYFVTFMPKNLPESRYNQVKGAVGYIANELLENAMKFCNGDSDKAISLSLNLSDDTLRFTLINTMQDDSVGRLTAFLDEFTSMDAGEFFVVQMERNMESESESGMGFATMVTDHDAVLGWKVDTAGEECELVTQVVISV